MRNKNDYSMSFYFEHNRVFFMEYVHNCYACTQWINAKFILWDYCIIYNRRTRAKIQHYEFGDFIPAKPKY